MEIDNLLSFVLYITFRHHKKSLQYCLTEQNPRKLVCNDVEIGGNTAGKSLSWKLRVEMPFSWDK